MTEQAATAPAADNPSLSTTDILNAVKVIDFACDQGAFKGWNTLENVARVRAKLLGFLQAVAPELLNPAPTEETKAPEAVSESESTAEAA
jgi:hypothetical protein